MPNEISILINKLKSKQFELREKILMNLLLPSELRKIENEIEYIERTIIILREGVYHNKKTNEKSLVYHNEE